MSRAVSERAKLNVLRVLCEWGASTITGEQIAELALYTPRHVRSVLIELERDGLIERSGGGRGKAYRYRVTCEDYCYLAGMRGGRCVCGREISGYYEVQPGSRSLRRCR